MTRSELRFAPWPLVGLFLAASGAAIFCVGFGFELEPGDRVRGLGVLRIFGPEGPRWGLFAFGALTGLTGLAALRRLVEGRPAAAIRYDGIELRGLFLSRYVPWRVLDRIELRIYRWNGEATPFIRIESRCPPGANPLHHWMAGLSYGVSAKLLRASDDEVAAWVDKARVAISESAAPPRPTYRAQSGFGRRVS